MRPEIGPRPADGAVNELSEVKNEIDTRSVGLSRRQSVSVVTISSALLALVNGWKRCLRSDNLDGAGEDDQKGRRTGMKLS